MEVTKGGVNECRDRLIEFTKFKQEKENSTLKKTHPPTQGPSGP